jgi:hypothetical protein
MLQVINGSKGQKERTQYAAIVHAWGNKAIEYSQALVTDPAAPECKEKMKQYIFLGVKVAIMEQKPKVPGMDYVTARIKLFEYLQELMSTLTPAELFTIFPLKKEYDGKKWQTKDYFYSMQSLEEFGLDTRIGDSIQDVLWEYWNDDIRQFVVGRMSVYDDLQRLRGEPTIAQQWADEVGLTTYQLQTDPHSGKRFMLEPKSGRCFRFYRKKPRHMQLLKN